ncbi:MAG: MFS transporter [Candidatus Nealsonbacteria bacterium]
MATSTKVSQVSPRRSRVATKTKVQVSPYRQALFYITTFGFWSALYVSISLIPIHAFSLPGASMSTVGLTIGLYSLALILFRIPLGLLSDRLGKRKPFILAGFLTIAIGFVGLALAPNIWVLAIARLVTGIGATTWVVLTVLFSSYWEEKKVPQVMGRLTLLMGLSPILVSYFGGRIAENFGISAVFYVAAFLALLGLLIATQVIEIAPVIDKRSRSFSLSEIINPLLIQVSVAAAVILLVVFTVSLGFLPVYANQLGASESRVVFLQTTMFFSFTLASFSASFLVARLDLRTAVLSGVCLTAIGSLVVPLVREANLLFVPQLMIGAGWGLTFPLLMSLSIKGFERLKQATAMGIFQAIYGVGMFIGPILGGAIAGLWGLKIIFYFCFVLCFIPLAITFKLPQSKAKITNRAFS